MTKLLPCLSLPDTTNQFDESYEVVLIAVIGYLSTALFTILFACLIFNIWNFLIKQEKWRVWSLSLFYVLATLDVGLRIWVSIYAVC